MNNLEELLSAYEVDVDFPDVSGMEHIQMLDTRSQLHRLAPQVSAEQEQRLLAADEKLLGQADLFCQAIAAIADLSVWRTTEGATPEQWWWYLDVLAQLPEKAVISSTKTVAT